MRFSCPFQEWDCQRWKKSSDRKKKCCSFCYIQQKLLIFFKTLLWSFPVGGKSRWLRAIGKLSICCCERLLTENSFPLCQHLDGWLRGKRTSIILWIAPRSSRIWIIAVQCLAISILYSLDDTNAIWDQRLNFLFSRAVFQLVQAVYFSWMLSNRHLDFCRVIWSRVLW